jgi:hypothetical protein
MEAITDFIVASKISGLFVMPIIVSLVFALLFKSKRLIYFDTLLNSLPADVAFEKVTDTLWNRQKTLIYILT